MTKVAIHQPEFLPFINFWRKMHECDAFILYETAQFSKGNFHNRNRFSTKYGNKWLTIPIQYKSKTAICDVQITMNSKWKEYHEIFLNQYSQYNEYNRLIIQGIMCRYNERYVGHEEISNLCTITKRLIVTIVDNLGLGLPDKIYNTLDDDLSKILLREFGRGTKDNNDPTQKLINLILVQCPQADTYISGPGGRDYLNLKLFKDHGIDVEFTDYKIKENMIPMSILNDIFIKGIDEVITAIEDSQIVWEFGQFKDIKR